MLNTFGPCMSFEPETAVDVAGCCTIYPCSVRQQHRQADMLRSWRKAQKSEKAAAVLPAAG
ncbi:hypothetical protein [Noviherbaspirillum suwonense]|jgi:hypothetical protein|uniref:hypothetical protein n=1 Tax=Noviherbaspirillum suwonense TaxID=1224511 RepID=UPI0024B859DF|nr:hypothetical protein [Noviherbaspirillum suwonense]